MDRRPPPTLTAVLSPLRWGGNGDHGGGGNGGKHSAGDVEDLKMELKEPEIEVVMVGEVSVASNPSLVCPDGSQRRQGKKGEEKTLRKGWEEEKGCVEDLRVWELKIICFAGCPLSSASSRLARVED